MAERPYLVQRMPPMLPSGAFVFISGDHMNSFNKTLLTLVLGMAVLTACSKQEEPVISSVAPKAPVPEEVKKEPVKEEPGGWVPPPAVVAPETAATAEPSAPVAPSEPTPAEKTK